MRRTIMWRVGAAAMFVSAATVLATPTAWAAKGNKNFGGYSTAVLTSVSATIIVPPANTISCSSTKAITVEYWAAITKAQYAANAGLTVKCTGGSAITYLAGDAGTVSFRFPVSPGDVLNVSASESPTSTVVTALDTTSSVGDTATYVGTTATPPPLLAQFGATSVSKSIPNVGPVTFNAVTVDGTQLVQSVATTRKLSRSHPPGVFPGPIVGGSFTLTET